MLLHFYKKKIEKQKTKKLNKQHAWTDGRCKKYYCKYSHIGVLFAKERGQTLTESNWNKYGFSLNFNYKFPYNCTAIAFDPYVHMYKVI